MPKLSIITINYNNAPGLRKTIESVVSQTSNDFEYIVIDGGSTDGSLEVIKQYAGKINYWVSEPDSGLYNAMNKGIDRASGEYCLFLNSGDVLCGDDVLKKIMGINCHADIFYGDMMIDHGNHLSLGKSPLKISFQHMMKDTLWHPVSFIKKGLFDKFGLYDENFKFAADYDFFLKTLIVGNVSTQYIPFSVSQFNLDGLSSNAANQEIIAKERKNSQLKYLPEKVLLFYQDYVLLEKEYQKLLNSKIFKLYSKMIQNPLLLRVLKFFGKVFH